MTVRTTGSIVSADNATGTPSQGPGRHNRRSADYSEPTPALSAGADNAPVLTMADTIAAELDHLAAQRQQEFEARQARTAELRRALAEAREAGLAERRRKRLERERPAGKRVRVTMPTYPRAVVPEGAVYVGRACYGLAGSPYYNPHRPEARTVEAHLAAVVEYRQWLRERPELVAGIRRDFADGRDAACWCLAHLPCHADAILAVARGEAP